MLLRAACTFSHLLVFTRFENETQSYGSVMAVNIFVAFDVIILCLSVSVCLSVYLSVCLSLSEN